jgi:hypothetical protein
VKTNFTPVLTECSGNLFEALFLWIPEKSVTKTSLKTLYSQGWTVDDRRSRRSSSWPVSRLTVLFNTIGAAVWALSVGALGYFFGHGLELLLGDVKRYEREAFLFLVAVGAGLWLVCFLLRRRGRAAASAQRERDCRPPRPRRLDWPRVFDLGRAREAPPVRRVGGFCW